MPSHSDSTQISVRYLAPAMLFVIHCFTPGVVSADEAILTGGVPSDGNVLLIGDKKQWDTFVSNDPIESASGYLAVVPDADEGAISAVWNGKGEAQLFVAHEGPADYSGHLERDAALTLVLKVNSKPNKNVFIRMGCGYPCAADADIRKLLGALPAEEWVRLSFDLRCFVDGGLDITNVDTPLLLTTRGKMSLSIADIGLVDSLGPEATIRCRD